MKYWKKHNKNNIAEQRFNQIKDYYDDWIWQKNSVASFGGYWADTSSSGSRASIWSVTPSNSYIYISARGVCNHRII